MRQRPVIAVFTLAFATILPALAWAIPGYSTADVNLRTGPSMANPVVTTIPHGAPVQILGCLSGWSWCDTAWAGYRGWVAGAYLSASWQGKAVPFVIYAPRLESRSLHTMAQRIGVDTTLANRGSSCVPIARSTAVCADGMDA